MHRLPDGTLRFSPRDLVAYLEGDFAAWCERMLAERDGAGKRGRGRAGLGRPRREGRGSRPRRPDGPGPRAPLPGRPPRPGAPPGRDRSATTARPGPPAAAMDAGAPVIYQAHLTSGAWHGYPDFLFRCHGNGCPCGTGHYTPWDTKLARSAKPHFLVQLCAYADMLEAVRGYRPGELVFVLGQGDERSYPTRDYFFYYRQLRRSFSRFQTGWRPDRVPDPGLDRGWGRWEAAAEQRLEASDHLSRVAGISRGQVRRLEDDGITHPQRPGRAEPARKVSQRVGPRVRAAPRPGSAPARVAPACGAALAAPAAGARGAPPRPGPAPPAVRRRRVLRHGRLPLRRARARVPVRRGDGGRDDARRSTTGGPTTTPRSGSRSSGSSTG